MVWNPPKIEIMKSKNFNDVTDELDKALEDIGIAPQTAFQKDVESYYSKQKQQEPSIVQTEHKVLSEWEKKQFEKHLIAENQSKMARLQQQLAELEARIQSASKPEKAQTVYEAPKEGLIRNIEFEDDKSS